MRARKWEDCLLSMHGLVVCSFSCSTVASYCFKQKGEGPCEDKAGFYCEFGFDCKSHKGTCFDNFMGHTEEGLREVVENCPASCGLCDSTGA